MKAINSPVARRAFWEKINKECTPKKVEAALSTVTEPSRRILQLCYHENRSFTEITKIVGKSLSIVRGYHNRGMIQLVKKLYPKLESPFDLLNEKWD